MVEADLPLLVPTSPVGIYDDVRVVVEALRPGHRKRDLPRHVDRLERCGVTIPRSTEEPVLVVRRVIFLRVIADQSQSAEIGRASCRERGCQYVENSVVAVSLKNKKKLITMRR